ncbi:amidohydrolase family protein [Bradyrhizobium betae]|uniref:Amidohydrolase-related domain-containing protein n=1 Tax=Bradyrhizobium betae TaxID=244734 RepID=A0A4V1P8D5_9BRAD|nr:amidohydrolase family protein [Bradyrhizobium betae]RXT54239.1 hypothetical protein B5V03_02005 [Bradyrhizobium betae]
MSAAGRAIVDVQAGSAAIVDVHTHVVPSKISSDASRGPRWPTVERLEGDKAAVVVGGKNFRAIDSRSWDVDRRLHDMDAEDVILQVLSPMPELLSHWLDPADSAYLGKIMNSEIAAMAAAAPNRFVGLGMITAQDPAAAVRELEEVARLGLCGVEVGTHINGRPLGDPALFPIYEAAEASGLAIFVHPLHPCGLDRIGGPGDVALVASFPLEIAMAALSLIVGGVMVKFPRLRVLLSHGGGALTSVLGRVSAVRQMVPSINASLPQDPWDTARRFWYDSNVYDSETLKSVVARLDPDRLVIGSDYPYAIRQPRPGAFLESSLPGMTNRCCDNASEWLFGERARLRLRCQAAH